MEENEKELKEFEDKSTDLVFKSIREISSQCTEIIDKTKTIGKYINIDTDLPNIAITFNNKLVELSQVFKQSGLSIYVQENDANGYRFPATSYIGEAVINNMIKYISQSIKELNSYTDFVTGVVKEKQEQKEKQIKVLQNENPFMKIWSKIKTHLFHNTKIESTYTKEEVDKAKSYLTEYKNIDDQLFNYNLKDHIVDSLVDYIHKSPWREDVVSEILEETIDPRLKKLGLEDSIPQLKERLEKDKDNTKNLDTSEKSWELSKEQREKIQIDSQKIAKENGGKRNDTPDISEDRESK